MKCEEFLPAMETGGLLQRFAARRHAARCAKCAGACEKLEDVKWELANVPQLEARDREIWERAALKPARKIELEEMEMIGWPRWLMPLGGAAVAACVVIVVFLWMHRGNVEVVKKVALPGPTTQPIEVEAVDAKGEFDRLTVAVDRLDAEIKELRQKAERKEAERQVAVVLDRFGGR